MRVASGLSTLERSSDADLLFIPYPTSINAAFDTIDLDNVGYFLDLFQPPFNTDPDCPGCQGSSGYKSPGYPDADCSCGDYSACNNCTHCTICPIDPFPPPSPWPFDEDTCGTWFPFEDDGPIPPPGEYL